MTEWLMSITVAFECVPGCSVCRGGGSVCEEHPDQPWEEGDGCCGAAGMPCPEIVKRHA